MTPGVMSLIMSQGSRREVLGKMVERYGGRGREGRSRLLDEVCELCGYGRKYAIKLLGGKTPIAGGSRNRGGPRPRYGETEKPVLKTIWLSAEQPCGKRLKAAVPLWLPDYERERGALERELRGRLLAMSATNDGPSAGAGQSELGQPGALRDATGHFVAPPNSHPDRTLECERAGLAGSGHGRTRRGIDGGRLLLEGHPDRCAHAMDRGAGGLDKGQHAVQERIAEVEAALPFAILGFDSDNGGEFINWHLADYFRLRKTAVAFTRSRAYRKNDNARVEQKNWTHVRQLVGYGRLDNPAQAELLNALYLEEWNLFRNFFCPVMKHVRTVVEGSRKKRVYESTGHAFCAAQSERGSRCRADRALGSAPSDAAPLRIKAAD